MGHKYCNINCIQGQHRTQGAPCSETDPGHPRLRWPVPSTPHVSNGDKYRNPLSKIAKDASGLSNLARDAELERITFPETG
jgi:hypothetical protein